MSLHIVELRENSGRAKEIPKIHTFLTIRG